METRRLPVLAFVLLAVVWGTTARAESRQEKLRKVSVAVEVLKSKDKLGVIVEELATIKVWLGEAQAKLALKEHERVDRVLSLCESHLAHARAVLMKHQVQSALDSLIKSKLALRSKLRRLNSALEKTRRLYDELEKKGL